MSIPVFSGADVEAAVTPARAVDAVRAAFVAYAADSVDGRRERYLAELDARLRALR